MTVVSESPGTEMGIRRGVVIVAILVDVVVLVVVVAAIVVGAHPGLVSIVDVVGLLKRFHKLDLTRGHGMLLW